jgi:hypothetical protein
MRFAHAIGVAAALAVGSVAYGSAWDAIFGGSLAAPVQQAPLAVSNRPHPAVVRVVVPEGDATSFGSGTLIDVRDSFGLVITNWHVVRDGHGDVEVMFPDGFTSKARALKVDADWDLAALVVWKPPVAPVKIAATAPQPGDRLTICGYGPGIYRAATGRCTKYYAPRVNFPEHMVELDVEARQGDSGGPIFNDRGELAGVLFGAGEGTTLGSFGGRVNSFLATLAPDIGLGSDAAAQLADAGSAPPISSDPPGALLSPVEEDRETPLSMASDAPRPRSGPASFGVAPTTETEVHTASWQRFAEPQMAATAPGGLLAHARNVLAAIGVLAIVMQVLRVVR